MTRQTAATSSISWAFKRLSERARVRRPFGGYPAARSRRDGRLGRWTRSRCSLNQAALEANGQAERPAADVRAEFVACNRAPGPEQPRYAGCLKPRPSPMRCACLRTERPEEPVQ